MLRDVIALYEKTDCYNTLKDNEEGEDIWEYLQKRLLEIRKSIDILFQENGVFRNKLNRIVDETEQFINTCEIPGVVKRWKKINSQIIYFDCVFEVLETSPNFYKKISRGLTNLEFACYPDEEFIEARKSYFAEVKSKMEEENIPYTEEKAFQNELLRTLTLVFENDFKEYL